MKRENIVGRANVEDTPELNLSHKNWIQSVSRGGGVAGEITLFDLLKAALPGRVPAGWLLRVQQTLVLSDSQPEPDLAIVRGTPRTYLARHPSAAADPFTSIFRMSAAWPSCSRSRKTPSRYRRPSRSWIRCSQA